MKANTTQRFVLLAVATLPIAALLLAAMPSKEAQAEKIARGKYLVTYGGCNDCHTPLKMTDKGPEPDMTRMLCGHLEGIKLPAPELKPDSWFAATAGMTAWAGPWGISYAANITPDKNTGIGIWSEEMFVKAMRTGKHMGNGRDILPPMPWRCLASLTDEDLKAVFSYLQTIPPVVNRVPAARSPKGEAYE
jgi:mono/diheme cytochrome c family protein